MNCSFLGFGRGSGFSAFSCAKRSALFISLPSGRTTIKPGMVSRSQVEASLLATASSRARIACWSSAGISAARTVVATGIAKARYITVRRVISASVPDSANESSRPNVEAHLPRRSQSLVKVLAEEGGDEPHGLVVLLRVGEEAVVAAVEVHCLDRFPFPP